MDLIELIRGKKVMVGAIDVATNTIETPEEVAIRYVKRFSLSMQINFIHRPTVAWRLYLVK
jgi:methionine synthase II (cobalamin-independent)